MFQGNQPWLLTSPSIPSGSSSCSLHMELRDAESSAQGTQPESPCPPKLSGQQTRILGNLRESQGLLAGDSPWPQGLRGPSADC